MFLKTNLNSINLENSVSSVGNIEPRLLKNDEARRYYDAYLKGKTPTDEFTFLSAKLMILVCNWMAIWISLPLFILIGWFEGFVVHIIVTSFFMYFVAISHHVEWYADTNQYAFIMRKILTGKRRISIYQRIKFDYISLYKKGEQQWSHSKTYYAICDKNQNHVLELDWKQHDYKINEFSEKFGFNLRDESREEGSHYGNAQAN